MPQYGMIVYAPAPADPLAMSEEHRAALNAYPEQAKGLKSKVLGGSYFGKQRGFALDPATSGLSVRGDSVSSGTLLGADLVVSAFYVLAAPSIEVAAEVAKLHPAAADGGIEIRPLFVPAGQIQDDYAD